MLWIISMANNVGKEKQNASWEHFPDLFCESLDSKEDSMEPWNWPLLRLSISTADGTLISFTFLHTEIPYLPPLTITWLLCLYLGQDRAREVGTWHTSDVGSQHWFMAICRTLSTTENCQWFQDFNPGQFHAQILFCFSIPVLLTMKIIHTGQFTPLHCPI